MPEVPPDGPPPLTLPFRVLELGDTLATAACGRMFAELGADVVALRSTAALSDEQPLARFALDVDKRIVVASPGRNAPLKRLVPGTDLIVVGGSPSQLSSRGIHPEMLRNLSPSAVIVATTPFGLTGPMKDYPSTDLTAFHGSGIALRMAGRVADPELDPPMRAAGEQSEFITGVTAACAAMQALYERQRSGQGQIIDVSTQEALACQAMDELARPAAGKPPSDRVAPLRRGGVVITSDGWVAVSPRENHQWKAWAETVLERPDLASGPRFSTRAARIDNWDVLHDFMTSWSSALIAAEIVSKCEGAHVPCFPFANPEEMLRLPQLLHREFFWDVEHPKSGPVRVPGAPHSSASPAHHTAARQVGPDEVTWNPRTTAPPPTATIEAPKLPLEGIRVLDFSWVIAGPTCTHYLAEMGAEVIKVENPRRPDPGRGSELHAVLGQSKLGTALDLKDPGGLDAALRLVEKSDVVVENFATGVMGRLGLGFDALKQRNPNIVLLSTSGLGRTGPDAKRPAYGNLLSAFTGFAELNGYPGRPPATGMAWADPQCGLMMAFSITAALHALRIDGSGRHIDFSMVEALLWAMPAPIVETQLGNASLEGLGNGHGRHAPHGVYRCAGEDDWVAVAATTDAEWRHIAATVPGLEPFSRLSEPQRCANTVEIDQHIAHWAATRTGAEAAAALLPQVPASASRSSLDLFNDPHLAARGFYRPHRDAPEGPAYPRIPWLTDGPSHIPTTAATIGEHTERVLRDVADLTDAELERLAASGALA